MRPLYTTEEFNQAKTRDLLPLECYECGKPFFVSKRCINQMLSGSNKRLKNRYCGKVCFGKSHDSRIEVKCDWCGKPRLKLRCETQKTKHHFCNRSCAAKYNNAHKHHGTRRSKLEVWLESQLTNCYPNLDIHFNRKDAINSELDIYIPSLHLAFELNGIYHYEPIHGPDKLQSIQDNDHRKFQACLERDIELCLIDTSSLKYFKPVKAERYLKIISDLVDKKRDDLSKFRKRNMVTIVGIEPTTVSLNG